MDLQRRRAQQLVGIREIHISWWAADREGHQLVSSRGGEAIQLGWSRGLNRAGDTAEAVRGVEQRKMGGGERASDTAEAEEGFESCRRYS